MIHRPAGGRASLLQCWTCHALEIPTQALDFERTTCDLLMSRTPLFSGGFFVGFVLSVCFSCTLLRVYFGAWSFLAGEITAVFAWFSVSITLS